MTGEREHEPSQTLPLPRTLLDLEHSSYDGTGHEVFLGLRAGEPRIGEGRRR